MLFNSFGTIASQAGGVIPPAFISAETSIDGAKVIAAFSKEMADPSGKHAQFTVMYPAPVSQYQEWSGYPDSIFLTADYPYQMIITAGGNVKLVMSTYPFIINSETTEIKYKGHLQAYNLSSNAWVYSWETTKSSYVIYGYLETFHECNSDVYADTSLTTVAFAKTTSDIAQNIVTAATLNATTTKIDLALTTAVTVGQTVTVAYTAGTVTSADTGILASFAAQEVTNNVAPPAVLYQEWSGYPDSPELTADYPYQAIYSGPAFGVPAMLVSQTPFIGSTGSFSASEEGQWKRYFYIENAWAYDWTGTGGIWGGGKNPPEYIMECNNDIYTDATLTTVWKAKTTP